MGHTITKDVITGKDAKVFVSNVSVDYADNDFKKIIFDPDNSDSYLLLTKKIGSKITIDDVKVITDNIIEGMIE